MTGLVIRERDKAGEKKQDQTGRVSLIPPDPSLHVQKSASPQQPVDLTVSLLFNPKPQCLCP